MANDRYLLGYTKTLEKVPYVSRPGSQPAYTLEKQRERLLPRISKLQAAARSVSPKAAPHGEVVAVVRMNPSALSRSAFPERLMRRADWRLLGSNSAWVIPEGGRGAGRDQPTLTTDLFVAAREEQFGEALQLLMAPERTKQDDQIAEDLCNIEDLRLMVPKDRVKPGIRQQPDDIEIVLHYNATLDATWRTQFTEFATKAGIHLDTDLEFHRRNLLFMVGTATKSAVDELAQFSFVRAVRPLPAPRPLEKPLIVRSGGKHAVLPTVPAIDPNVTIAVFDGGLPSDHPFKQWVTTFEPTSDHDIGYPVEDFQAHGVAVTSAALFGSIVPNVEAPIPFCRVHHYRVLGTQTLGKKGLYRSLALIDDVLAQREYSFVSLSIGPPEPMDNDTVNPWTILLDDHLSDGTSLACVAVGNNGGDAPPACRIMAPADSVNALGVGACDAADGDWCRTSYSAIGPGRSPGLIKPDLLHFGGCNGKPYLFAGVGRTVLQQIGTSFSTPGTARIATGLRVHLGSSLSPVALKALLIHGADPGEHAIEEVGWGRAAHVLHDVVICQSGRAKVVYSGKLQPGAVLRAPILVPEGLSGDVTIRATLCYNCRTDPNTPGDYTRAAIEPTFRPHCDKFTKKKKGAKRPVHPTSDSFFKQHDHLPEDERRLLAQKWNTVMHGERRKRATSLKDPCFDLHYIARAPGRSITPSDAPDIHYALVITIVQEKTKDLYERLVAAFPNEVSSMTPAIPLEPPTLDAS